MLVGERQQRCSLRPADSGSPSLRFSFAKGNLKERGGGVGGGVEGMGKERFKSCYGAGIGGGDGSGGGGHDGTRIKCSGWGGEGCSAEK